MAHTKGPWERSKGKSDRQAESELLSACRRLEIEANHVNQLQHAGTEIGPAAWAELYESCNIARAAIAKAEETKI